jgi:NAD(P)-dependent dehydrogenase (short-subunit alcohol dehydrogenase family)
MTHRTLEGRTAIITGASQGLGKAIASAYVDAGANVVLCARDAKLLRDTASELQKSAGDAGRVVSLPADVAREQDVRRVVGAALEHFGKLEILVNNAGVYGPMGSIDEVPWEAWVDAISINLLGSVRFAREVVPHLKAQRYGKIIQLSGGGAASPLPRISAYAASKAAVVRFAETLALEVRPFHVDVNSIAAGALNTRLLDQVLRAGPAAVGAEFFARSERQRAQGGTPMEVPAQLAVFLASASSDGITGKLVSAVWDDWQSFPRHLQELSESDVYTLRRIVARDRGLGWGDK